MPNVENFTHVGTNSSKQNKETFMLYFDHRLYSPDPEGGDSGSGSGSDNSNSDSGAESSDALTDCLTDTDFWTGGDIPYDAPADYELPDE
jgi:hypothetical protein